MVGVSSRVMFMMMILWYMISNISIILTLYHQVEVYHHDMRFRLLLTINSWGKYDEHANVYPAITQKKMENAPEENLVQQTFAVEFFLKKTEKKNIYILKTAAIFLQLSFQTQSFQKIACKTSWWSQPVWKICVSNWIISPIFGVKVKNIWNHHPENPI